MLDDYLSVVRKIEEAGFSAYLVGGFVRDYIMGIESNDIDVTTNAKPKELLEIFEDAILPKDDYGAVCLYVGGVRFQITTFRREIKYDNRRPSEIEYIDDLHEDLLRRDFTINTICMDKDGNIVDLLDGREDINNRIIRTIGDVKNKFYEDPLRILRCIRFASKFGFSIDEEIDSAIRKNHMLLRNISYERKMEELNKMFVSNNADCAIRLLLEYGLDESLELVHLKDVKYTGSLIGIWAVLNVCDIYKFSNNEMEQIKMINKALSVNNLDPYNLYKFGLYANSVAGAIKGGDVKKINLNYNELSIHSRGDILIGANDIINIFRMEPGPYIKEVFEKIEKAILYHEVENDREELINYCKNLELSEVLSYE